MNMPLFRATFRINWIITMIFASLLCLYMISILSLYNPDSSQIIADTMKLLPSSLVKMMGIQGIPSDLAGFISSYFYGMLVFLIPLVYVSIMGNRLVTKLVDNRSMAYLLTTPIKRSNIVMTQAIYFLGSIMILFLFLTGTTIGLCTLQYPGYLDLTAFISLNICACLLTCAISSISFFFACLFNETRYALAFGVGVPVFLFMLHVLSGVADLSVRLADLSLYHLFRATDIVAGRANILLLILLYLAITFVLYGAGLLIFNRRNLPL